MHRHTSSIVFGVVVVICLAQVAWWIGFQVRESVRLERAAEQLEAGHIDGALRALNATYPGELAEEARSRRAMFASEGAALGILVLVGVVFFYTALLRERRMRANQQRFLTGATHELKTPLTTIRLGLESLERGTLPDERRSAYLRGMVREIDRLERGLTNILTAAGLEHAGNRPREVGDLADDLRRALDAFHERCVTAEIRCRAETLEACPVRRDAAAMRIVLHNLLDNAVKFTPSGGEIDVALRAVGGQARLEVRDDGCGIAREDLERIFERFQRGEGPEHVGGTGLGLALVKEIVEAHGGRVAARSEGRGKGATFTLSLPLSEVPA
jgi:signal transduction histidine kinase